jgi:hypothetical protein
MQCPTLTGTFEKHLTSVFSITGRGDRQVTGNQETQGPVSSCPILIPVMLGFLDRKWRKLNLFSMSQSL